MVLMRIVELACGADQHRAIVVLEDMEQRIRLAFSTDPHEAHRLAREMGHARCSCNPVYDFMQSLLGAFRATISHVVLDDMGSKGIGAIICLRLGEVELTRSWYPPGALALALRAKVPIYATAQALAHAHPLSPPPDGLPSSSTEAREWLERVRPEDF